MLPLIEKKKRFKIVIGGRGSAKSLTVAKILAAKVHQESCRVLAAREHMNSLSDSVHSTLMTQIREHQMDGFSELANEIRHERGGNIIYRGLARNPEGLKSVDNVKYAWIEEAQTISEKSLEMLTPSIRAKGSEIWMTANPRSSKDAFSQRFIKPFEKELKKDGIMKMTYTSSSFVTIATILGFPLN
jgi:phage terminase large subunit